MIKQKDEKVVCDTCKGTGRINKRLKYGCDQCDVDIDSNDLKIITVENGTSNKNHFCSWGCFSEFVLANPGKHMIWVDNCSIELTDKLADLIKNDPMVEAATVKPKVKKGSSK